MRTPSIYSQDDPLTAALQPDPGETDNERRMRVFREAEAKRISEQIDEDIRQERERMKRSKGDVKVRGRAVDHGRGTDLLCSCYCLVRRRAGSRPSRSSSS